MRHKNTLFLIFFVLCSFIFLLSMNNGMRETSGNISPKPLILAHRGASSLAPENTMVAAQIASESGADGWEADVRISHDGIPFLMHDDTLNRTTDVEVIFPEKAALKSSSFTWSELEQLDAGSFFVETDPFGSIKEGLISNKTAQSYKGARIPSLIEALNFSRDNNFIIELHLKGVFEGHPHYDNYFKLVFIDILESKIDLNLVLFLNLEKHWLNVVQNNNISIPFGIKMEEYIEDYRNTNYRNFFIKKGKNDMVSYDLVKSLSIPFQIYPVNDEETYYKEWFRGTHIILTDYPFSFSDLNIESYVSYRNSIQKKPPYFYIFSLFLTFIKNLGDNSIVVDIGLVLENLNIENNKIISPYQMR